MLLTTLTIANFCECCISMEYIYMCLAGSELLTRLVMSLGAIRCYANGRLTEASGHE